MPVTTESNIQVTTLPNGLRVATERVPGALSVATGVWVGVGARDEPMELSGVSHFLEHLLFKGTDARSAQDIARSVDRVGGDMNAFTTKETTAYYCRLPADRMTLGLEILGDVLCNPALRPDDVDMERQVILEELAMDDDSPDDVAHRLLSEAVFPDHPLGWETAGRREIVEVITADDVRKFHDARYVAAAMVVAVAGAIDHDEVVTSVAEQFAGIRVGAPVRNRLRPGGAAAQEIWEDDDTEQVHLVIGMQSPDRHDPSLAALDVVNHVFGGGMSSRLFEEIREKRGLVYSVYSGAGAYSDAGIFTIYAGSQPRHLAEVRGLIDLEIDKLCRDGITDEELEIAQGYLCGAYVMGLEDTGSRMSRLGGQMMAYGEIRPVAQQVDKWRAVTLDDARSVIERVFAGPRVEVAVGPR